MSKHAPFGSYNVRSHWCKSLLVTFVDFYRPSKSGGERKRHKKRKKILRRHNGYMKRNAPLYYLNGVIKTHIIKISYYYNKSGRTAHDTEILIKLIKAL